VNLIHGAEDDSDIRERLFVAEKVMKSLFERNKQLEQLAENPARTPPSNCCTQKDILIQELKAKLSSKPPDDSQDYKELMSTALHTAQSQAKVYLNQYIEVRDRLALLIERNSEEPTTKKNDLTTKARDIADMHDRQFKEKSQAMDQLLEKVSTSFNLLGLSKICVL
jgi:hypothetical protein